MKRIFRSREKIDEIGTISHITQRAPGKELLFLEKADYLYMLYLIKETALKFSLDLFSFILMPNHVHLLLMQSKENLSNAMKNLFERYANYFNGKYERKGHVFCSSYKQAVCMDENYLFTITVYIHLNAVRANLIKDPLDYQWSSVKPYVMPINSDTFLNYKYILNMLDSNIDKARAVYNDILKQALNIKSEDVLENSKGLSIFKNNLNKIITELFNNKIERIDIFSMDLDKKIDELKVKRRLKKPQDIEARKYLIQQLMSRGYNIEAIAERLGISRQSVYANLTKQAMLKV